MRPFAIGGQAAYSVPSMKFEWCAPALDCRTVLLSVRGSIGFSGIGVCLPNNPQ